MIDPKAYPALDKLFADSLHQLPFFVTFSNAKPTTTLGGVDN
ncbi:hypothetical protein AAGG52_01975 [Bacillus licheniformis]